MAVGVGGRILIRHLGRCEMGKWDKLSRRGVQGSRAFMLLFGEFFFFFSSAILAKVQKGLVREKQAPTWNGRQLFHRTVGGTYVSSFLPYGCLSYFQW